MQETHDGPAGPGQDAPDAPDAPGAKDRPLRLEYVDPASLDDNPRNWRRHPALQKEALEAALDEVGWAGAACNGKILVPSRPHAEFPSIVQDAGKMVPFICVGFRRAVFNRVGGLDEQFVDYGFEDDDFCRSARTAGWKIGVLKSVAVNHEFLPSTYRSSGVHVSLEPNRLRYIQKWGDHEGA
jgi:hypothetical protein